ncbi:MAG: hypothetical protein FWD16_07640, partial [Clostridia bacterium]|nr:hypothetical protein [Clostridia bacterium]
PDSVYPVPTRSGKVIPYDAFTPPEYVWGVAYYFNDKTVMQAYQRQLRSAGFEDLGEVQSVESLWQLEKDGNVYSVEMYSEGEQFSMTMYVNYED